VPFFSWPPEGSKRRRSPDHWRRFEATSLLGAAVAAQQRFAEAESLLVSGYEALAGQQYAPALRKEQALERVVGFYRDRGKPDMAAAWQKKRAGGQNR
jgi:hypothetical protein